MNEQTISSLIPLADGKVLVAGSFNYPGSSVNKGLGRLQQNGLWDVSFAANNYVQSNLTLWNGLIYGQSIVVYRFLPDGNLDPSFIQMNTGPYFGSGLGGNYFVYPDGRILMSGTHHLHDSIRGYEGVYNLVWFSNQGYLDTTAHHRSCNGTGHIEYIHPLPNGNFLLGGFWSEYDGIPLPNSTHLIRVFPDGALDMSFQCPITWGAAAVHKLLADGKHLVGGILHVANDPDTIQLVRLMPDGAVDESFHYDVQLLLSWENEAAYTSIGCIFPISGSRMIVTGGFDSVDGEQRGGVAMLDSSGQLVLDEFDGAACGVWNDGFQDFAYIQGMVPAPDGNFYIHGSYRGYDDGTTNDAGQKMVSRLYGLDVGVDEKGKSPMTVSITPNPSTGRVVVKGSASMEIERITVNDLQGRLEWDAGPLARSSTTTLDLSSLAMGPHIVTALDRLGDPQHMKLLIQR